MFLAFSSIIRRSCSALICATRSGLANSSRLSSSHVTSLAFRPIRFEVLFCLVFGAFANKSDGFQASLPTRFSVERSRSSSRILISICSNVANQGRFLPESFITPLVDTRIFERIYRPDVRFTRNISRSILVASNTNVTYDLVVTYVSLKWLQLQVLSAPSITR